MSNPTLIEAYLQKEGWPCTKEVNGSATIYHFPARGAAVFHDARLIYDRTSSALLCIATAPIVIHTSRRTAVLQLISLINAATVQGGFEITMDRGEIRARIGCYVGDGRLDDSLIERMIQQTILLLNNWWAALMQVGFSLDDPEEVFQLYQSERSGKGC